MSGEVNGLLAKIKEIMPPAVFVYCMTGNLNLMLQKRCNTISKCQITFAAASDYPFFHSFAKQTYAADKVVERRVSTPVSVITPWKFNSKILSHLLVCNKWGLLKEIFPIIFKDSNYHKHQLGRVTAS